MAASPASVELRQSAVNALQLPILIAVCLLAVVISEVAHGHPSATVLAVCGVATALTALLTWWLLRRDRAALLVTTDAITFTRGRNVALTISRVPDSKLTFRMARNGPLGSEHTAYILKLRDEATGKEVFAGAFGRTRVQKACESQGWTFS